MPRWPASLRGHPWFLRTAEGFDPKRRWTTPVPRSSRTSPMRYSASRTHVATRSGSATTPSRSVPTSPWSSSPSPRCCQQVGKNTKETKLNANIDQLHYILPALKAQHKHEHKKRHKKLCWLLLNSRFWHQNYVGAFSEYAEWRMHGAGLLRRGVSIPRSPADCG